MFDTNTLTTSEGLAMVASVLLVVAALTLVAGIIWAAVRRSEGRRRTARLVAVGCASAVIGLTAGMVVVRNKVEDDRVAAVTEELRRVYGLDATVDTATADGATFSATVDGAATDCVLRVVDEIASVACGFVVVPAR